MNYQQDCRGLLFGVSCTRFCQCLCYQML